MEASNERPHTGLTLAKMREARRVFDQRKPADGGEYGLWCPECQKVHYAKDPIACDYMAEVERQFAALGRRYDIAVLQQEEA